VIRTERPALPHHDRVFGQGAGGVEVPRRVVVEHVAEPLAGGAGPLRVVGGEQALGERRQLGAAPGAPAAARKRRQQQLAGGLYGHVGRPRRRGRGGRERQQTLVAPLGQRRPRRFEQAVPFRRRRRDAVHHHQRRRPARPLLGPEQAAAAQHAGKAHPLDQLPRRRPAPPRRRREAEQHRDRGAGERLGAPGGDRGGGVDGDAPAASRAVACAGFHHQEAEVVGQVGERPDGGARVLDRPALAQRHRRQQPVGRLQRRLGELVHELPQVGREGFEEAELALGEQGVERQAGLARAAHAGHGGDLPMGKDSVNRPEVVRAHPPQPDGRRRRRGRGGFFVFRHRAII